MDLGLNGKSVLITGGSKGIGLACVRAFAAESCRVHIASRNPENLEAAKERIRKESGLEPNVYAVDLREPGSAKALLSQSGAVDTGKASTRPPAQAGVTPRRDRRRLVA